MSSYQENITKHKKNQNQQFEEIEQATKSDSAMAGMLEISDHEFKIIVINMLKA